VTVKFEAFANVGNGAGGGAGSWRHGTGVPSNALGVNGDFYGDDSTGLVYEKAAGVYSSVGTLGPVQATSFSDNFTRANSNSWGPNYIQTPVSSNNGTAYVRPSIVSNRGRTTGVGTAGNGLMISMPISLVYVGAAAASQYAECTVPAVNGTQWVCLPMVCCSPNVLHNDGAAYGAYAIYMTNGDASLYRLTWIADVNGGPSLTLMHAALWAFTAGDVARLEATISGSTWTLTAKRNGTTVYTTTDANVGAGMPALITGSYTLGNWCELSSFNAGLL
jgi:hypothetical protein